jgi:23S rRNA-/tRNA-specific pseudouridylate synthase
MKISITPEPLKTIMPTERIDCRIPATCAGMRLDQALAELLPHYSRNRLQQWLKAGQLRVDGALRRPRDPVTGGEIVSGELTLEVETTAVAQDIPLAMVYEDADLLVINKPAGLVVHPAAGNRDGTLVNALLHHSRNWRGCRAPGWCIVWTRILPDCSSWRAACGRIPRWLSSCRRGPSSGSIWRW